ncbi:MAG: NAD(P)-binding domain-containing protein [Phreatobacter sp.]|uniref:NAD(P)-binding domain-containing protein n=1 Tax=Phreatobacter sp. TaxID=1966341 RepID=UPI002734550C|nr:NAD(P)-binding domain-containing protein [Phreatobacter sp.]MDP2801919.1 NAD(P)-binding domain-containing protein [Phreatobacter sp.]
MRNMTMHDGLPVVVIGAGPVGLAAAAELAERNIPFRIIEKAPAAAGAVSAWAHVRLFSPWRFNVSDAAARLLAETGWRRPPEDVHPTGGELIRDYLAPLAAHPAIVPHLQTDAEVVAVARAGTDRVRDAGREARPFLVRLRSAAGETEMLARAVIDTSGTWSHPNRALSGGLGALGETEPAVAAHIAYAMPDVLGQARARYAGRRVAVLGSGHSAIGTLLDLGRIAAEAPGTSIVWLLRADSVESAYRSGADDQLAERGALATTMGGLVASGRIAVRTGIRVARLAAAEGALAIVTDGGDRLEVDELVVATGFRPDHGLAAELRLALDPALECPVALAPLIDPNQHSCGTVRPHGHAALAHPDAGYFIAGMKSYGRAPTFLMATGHEQVRSIVAHLAGDDRAAADVRLVLPETGVCSTDRIGGATTEPGKAQSCCGGGTAAARVLETQD